MVLLDLVYLNLPTTDGGIYSWGRGRGGRLGRETEEDVFKPQKMPFEFSSSKFSSFKFPSHQVKGVSSCHAVTMLLTVPLRNDPNPVPVPPA